VKLRYFYNGNIITMNPDAPRSGHMLVAGERIWSCRNDAKPLGLDWRDPAFNAQRRALSPEVEFTDLCGASVIPGLVDCHAHFLWWAVNLTYADLTGTRSEEEAVEIMRTHARQLPKGDWLIGFGWTHNLWEDPRLPTRKSLDEAFGDTPVFLSSKCSHLAWVNSAALARAGVDASTPDPVGGQIERRPDGGGSQELTGILKETAMGLVESKIDQPSEETFRQALARGQKIAHGFGLTGVHSPEYLHTWEFMQRAHAEGALKVRVNFLAPLSLLGQLEELKVRQGLGDDWLRIAGVKAFCDGSLGGRTALMHEPFEGEPENRGIRVLEAEELFQATLRSNRVGLPIAIHAIGDRAVDDALTAFERAGGELEAMGLPAMQNRIEHLQLFAGSSLERLGRVRPVASVQPIHLCADMGPADRYWGKRSRYAYAFRSLAEAGCTLVFGSDAPVEPINPFLGIYAAATRKDLNASPDGGWYPEERISVEQAIAAYTRNAAQVAGQSAILGQLEQGKLADFVVIAEDPIQGSPEGLRSVEPLATFIGGECVYAKPEWMT
jgi:predicted amidohydrolase YtcJ